MPFKSLEDVELRRLVGVALSNVYAIFNVYTCLGMGRVIEHVCSVMLSTPICLLMLYDCSIIVLCHLMRESDFIILLAQLRTYIFRYSVLEGGKSQRYDRRSTIDVLYQLRMYWETSVCDKPSEKCPKKQDYNPYRAEIMNLLKRASESNAKNK